MTKRSAPPGQPDRQAEILATCEDCGLPDEDTIPYAEFDDIRICPACVRRRDGVLGRAPKNAQIELPPLAELLDSTAAAVRRFVVLTEAQATVIALWVAHAHAAGAADTTPYLAITSAEKRSGKSRLMEVLAELVPNPIVAANISEAALFRALGGDTTATLLFDEIDATFGPKARDKEDLRALINAGYRRGTPAWRCVGEGGKQKVQAFEVFGPKALAGIGDLPDTIADRSIPIRLRRRSRSEPVERGRHRIIVEAAEPLREVLGVWGENALDHLRVAKPVLPDELDDRAQDGAEPLLAIADLAGEWSRKARRALLSLYTDKPDDADSWGVQLLAGIRMAFGEDDRIPTLPLIDRLKDDDEAPWLSWGEHGLTPRGMSKMLDRYGIKSRTIRVGGETAKGYLREHFEDAFSRYLPPGTPSIRNIRNNGSNKPETAGFYPSQEGAVLRKENPHKPHEQAVVSDVTDRGPNKGRDAESRTLADTDRHEATGRDSDPLDAGLYDDDGPL